MEFYELAEAPLTANENRLSLNTLGAYVYEVTSFTVNGELAPGWPLSQIGRPAEAVYLTDRTDLDVLTIGPSKEAPEVYFWWKFCNPPLDLGPGDLPRQYDDLMVAVQISPRRYVGDVAAYLFLDSHVKALPFGQTWGDRLTNLHYAFK